MKREVQIRDRETLRQRQRVELCLLVPPLPVSRDKLHHPDLLPLILSRVRILCDGRISAHSHFGNARKAVTQHRVRYVMQRMGVRGHAGQLIEIISPFRRDGIGVLQIVLVQCVHILSVAARNMGCCPLRQHA